MTNKVFYPLTHPQKGIWYTEKFYPGTGISNIVGTLTFPGDVNYLILNKAINLMLKSNEGMRLRIIEDAIGARQYIADFEEKEFDFLDFSDKDGWVGFQDWIDEERKIPINAINSDLYNFIMIKISNQEGGFLAKAHHTIVDAWTMILMGNQISEYYLKLKEGITPAIYQLPSYIDYIKSEKEYEESADFADSKLFWLKKFETIPDVTTLKPNKKLFASCEASRKTFTISRELTTNLYQFAENFGVSVFVILLSMLTIYLHRVLDKTDIVVGTPLLNRATVKEKLTIGMFIETIPIRLQIDNDLDFESYILKVMDEWRQMRKHRYPYNLLLEDIRQRQKLTSNLYDIMIDYQNVKFDIDQSIKPKPYFSGSEANSLCLHISDRENSGQLNFDIDYQIDLFSEVEIVAIFNHLITLLGDALKNPSKKIMQLELMNSRDRDYILYELNNTCHLPLAISKTIHKLFEEQVIKTPNHIAVIDNHTKISYAELNASANRLARVLRAKGVKSGSIVGVLADRSHEIAVIILAILKAGGAYLPLDPHYPPNRMNFILQDSKAELLILQKHFMDQIFHCPKLVLEDTAQLSHDGSDLTNINNSSDLAYILYTSGSTGVPKGVMVEHKSVCNFFAAMAEQVDLPGKTILSVTNVTFDIFVFEMLLPLVNGLTVVIADDEQQLVPMALNKLILENGVNIIQTTPSRMNLILMDKSSQEALKNVTDIVLGGEAFSETLLKKLKDITKARIFNGYGPTEATVYTTFKELTNHYNITIGRPVANVKVYVLDKNMTPLPVNVPGELYIGGEGLAKGYLNRPELNQEKFLPSPFQEGERLYRTGDLVKWTFDGELEFLGRMDFQVKIRGYRIELGEIENILMQHTHIIDTAVLAQTAENGDQYLSAYIVAEKPIPTTELRQYLSQSLPAYMIPSSFVFLKELPLNANGKVCRNTLMKIQTDDTKRTVPYAKARNEVDSILIKNWTEVLDYKKIGIDDNFFDIGGDSLKIVRLLVSFLPFNWDLTARDFYKYQTIRNLSDKIRGVNDKESWQEGINHHPAEIYCAHNIDEIHVSANRKEMRKILLTGATGYLGAHILKELLITTDAQIYCLVRSSSREKAAHRLLNILSFYFPDNFSNELDRRIKVIKGDLASDNFGLSEQQYNSIGRQVDTVIHTAAKVRHYGGYADFETINVLGTKRIVNFCLTFKQKLHYISTTSVSGRYLVKQDLGDAVFSENDFFIGQHYYENVYVRSKFEAENIILSAMNDGLTATIYRVGMLSGRYSDGHFQANIQDNGLYNRMKSVILLRAIPEDLLKQELEYTPVDYCSRAIILLAKINENKNKIFHIFNDKMILVSQFIEASKLCGFDIQIQDAGSFNDYLKKIICDRENTWALTGIINDLNLTKTIGLQHSPEIASEITCQYLQQLGFKWPDIDLPYLIKVINYMESIGFLKKNFDTQEKDILA